MEKDRLETHDYENNEAPRTLFPRVRTILGSQKEITNLGVGKGDFVTINTFSQDGTEEIINFSLLSDSQQVYVNQVIAKSPLEWEIHVFNDGAANAANIKIRPLILVIPK